MASPSRGFRKGHFLEMVWRHLHKGGQLMFFAQPSTLPHHLLSYHSVYAPLPASPTFCPAPSLSTTPPRPLSSSPPALCRPARFRLPPPSLMPHLFFSQATSPCVPWVDQGLAKVLASYCPALTPTMAALPGLLPCIACFFSVFPAILNRSWSLLAQMRLLPSFPHTLLPCPSCSLRLALSMSLELCCPMW